MKFFSKQRETELQTLYLLCLTATIEEKFQNKRNWELFYITEFISLGNFIEHLAVASAKSRHDSPIHRMEAIMDYNNDTKPKQHSFINNIHNVEN